MNKRVYGIDLGTTYSCIAYVDDHGQPAVIPNTEGDLTTPSVVFFESHDSVVVGKSAKAMSNIEPDKVAAVFKRSMGDPAWTFPFEGRDLSPQEVSSYVLRKLVADAEQNTGDKIDNVVITCPAYFGINQKEATKQAGEIAGLNVLYVIPEPTAAALAYGLKLDEGVEQVVMVYDLGGGTFDATLIEVKDGHITVISTGGAAQLGGKNWDEEIVHFFCQAFEEATGTSAEDLRSDPEAFQELLIAAEQCKQALTTRKVYPYLIRFGGERVKVELTRERFEEITKKYLDQTIELTYDMLGQAKSKGYEQIDMILLVGGSTYMPQVKERLRTEFSMEIRHEDPNQIVAKGAAQFGFMAQLKQEFADKVFEVTGRRLTEEQFSEVSDELKVEMSEDLARRYGLAGSRPVEALISTKVTNVTSKGFGIVVTDRETQEEMVSNLIYKDAKVPAEISKEFFTILGSQAGVDIRLMENEAMEQLGDNSELISLDICSEIGYQFLKFKKDLPENSPILVKFELSQDGLLRVDAFDRTTEEKIDIEVRTNAIMTKEEVSEVKNRALAINVS